MHDEVFTFYFYADGQKWIWRHSESVFNMHMQVSLMVLNTIDVWIGL